jgi:hypothetical protein
VAEALRELPAVEELRDKLRDKLDESSRQPAEPVHVRISHDFMQTFLERVIKAERLVNDNVLGADVDGVARTTAHLDLVFQPSDGQAVVDLIFTGKTNLVTTGHKGPVVMNNRSTTTFAARKRLILNTQRVVVGPTTVNARTYSQASDVDSNAPGLRGLITRRIGRRRVERLRPTTDAIATNRIKRFVGEELDRRAARSISDISDVLRAHLPKLVYDKERPPANVHVRSRPKCIEMCIYRPDATEEERACVPPEITDDPDISIRVFRDTLIRAMTEPELRKNFQPLLMGLLAARPSAGPKLKPREGVPDIDFDVDVREQWVLISFWADVEGPLPVDRLDAPPETAASQRDAPR